MTSIWRDRYAPASPVKTAAGGTAEVLSPLPPTMGNISKWASSATEVPTAGMEILLYTHGSPAIWIGSGEI